MDRNPTGQQGSAYIIALLVLLLLTTIGLALVFVTSTEMQIGANERTTQRNLAAADSGSGVALARILTTNNYSAGEFFLAESSDEDPGNPPLIQTRLNLEAPLILSDAPCNLCSINNAGSYGEKQFRRGNLRVVARGQRPGIGGVTSEVLVSTTLDLQPVELSTLALQTSIDNNAGSFK